MTVLQFTEMLASKMSEKDFITAFSEHILTH